MSVIAQKVHKKCANLVNEKNNRLKKNQLFCCLSERDFEPKYW